jgi:hypothetical protein
VAETALSCAGPGTQTRRRQITRSMACRSVTRCPNCKKPRTHCVVRSVRIFLLRRIGGASLLGKVLSSQKLTLSRKSLFSAPQTISGASPMRRGTARDSLRFRKDDIDCAPGTAELGPCPTDAARGGRSRRAVRVSAAMPAPERQRRQSSRHSDPVEPFQPPFPLVAPSLISNVEACLCESPDFPSLPAALG